MGKVKDHYIEMQNHAFELRLARKLGISLDDLMRLEWSIETDESEDGVTYCHRVEFSGSSPRVILSKIDGLQDGCRVCLQPGEIEQDSDYESLFDAIIHEKKYVGNFKDALINLDKLIAVEIDEERLRAIFYRQAFISVISTMEAFLTDAFINLTFGNKDYFRNFVESHPAFRQMKFELREIFAESEKLRETAKKVSLDANYHNLPAIKRMYEGTFKIRFPSIEEMHRYVLIRHDLVHRNGKTKDGQEIEVDEDAVREVIDKANEFIGAIVRALSI